MSDRQTDSKPTLGAEWRRTKNETYTVKLPSGNWATLRPLLLDRLIAGGQVPNVLLPWALKTLYEGADLKTLSEQAENAKGFADLVNWIVAAAMVDPVVVDAPKADNEIALSDLHFRDKFRIFDLSTEPAEWLKSFRDKQTKRLAGIHDGEGGSEPAQPPFANP